MRRRLCSGGAYGCDAQARAPAPSGRAPRARLTGAAAAWRQAARRAGRRARRRVGWRARGQTAWRGGRAHLSAAPRRVGGRGGHVRRSHVPHASRAPRRHPSLAQRRGWRCKSARQRPPPAAGRVLPVRRQRALLPQHRPGLTSHQHTHTHTLSVRCTRVRGAQRWGARAVPPPARPPRRRSCVRRCSTPPCRGACSSTSARPRG